MNKTPAELIAAATRLFASHGYEGTSIRAITRMAGANLGAITYHFGSKEALYEAVFSSVVEPSREYVAQAAGAGRSPLDRIERFVRGLFRYLHEHPEMPRLLLQHLTGARPLPSAARKTMQANIQLVASLIAQGQEDRSIRQGNARHMALSIGSQPIYLTLVRRALREGAAIDQNDPDTQQQIVDSVVEFVRAGLANHPESQP